MFLFSKKDGAGNAFFTKADWLSFWGATLVSLGVYTLTLGPSVGLEDSGELATAGNFLGVPHPPGYPLWTMFAWLFCRAFDWLTYLGHPTPAWSISFMSAVFGAFAAGCTAMLITSSARDMLRGAAGEGASERHREAMAVAAGLGGSLVFAFSPVMWSQSTIVEIYSLNALFLMWVLLLTYRWMRKPSDKILWLTAFIFGLGLTNYQVLLFAAVPLVFVILVSDVALFRDFAIMLIPAGLTAQLLKMVSLERASRDMTSGVIAKHWPWGQTLNSMRVPDQSIPGVFKDVVSQSTSLCHAGDTIIPETPDETLLWAAAALAVLAAVAGFAAKKFFANRPGARKDLPALVAAGTAGLGALAALASTFVTSPAIWLGSGPSAKIVGGVRETMRHWPPSNLDSAPLWDPRGYAAIAATVCLCIAAALYLAFTVEKKLSEAFRTTEGKAAFAVMSVSAAAAVLIPLVFVDMAGFNDFNPDNAASWTVPAVSLAVGVAAMLAMSYALPRGLLFSIPAAAVQISLFTLAYKGAMTGLTDPNTWWFRWPLIWNFAILGLAWATLPNGRRVAFAALFAELGVSFYAYMPIVSDLRNPPMNWGYPRTWEGFKHALMRGQYEEISFSDGGFKRLMEQFGFYLTDLRVQFTLVAATLALIPFAAWRLRLRGGKTVKAVNFAAALYLAVAALVVASEISGGEPPWRIDKWLILAIGLLVLVGAITVVLRQGAILLNRLFCAVKGGKAVDPPAPAEGIAVSVDDTCQRWLLGTGVCFFMMSFVLIALANVKGDVQDGFIQKVKFISSHGIFSIWIGYGLAFGLAVANRWTAPLLRNSPFRRAVSAAFLAAAVLTCVIPVWENYTNDNLIKLMGSAEQNGHTFGWQFGAYQLEGERAISRELSADEEPLPNPDWPKPMDPGALFFGGTDPGRFVPTYMIYAADFRPDVHLITQNALADGTYMSVERDLYGHDIWIPDTDDVQEAFERYRNEFGGDGENGRLQVTGAQNVMKINAILARMMFDHERLRRSFYIEESYQIPWMYPYLEPHGLIMQISSDVSRDGKPASAIPVSDATVRADMDFWDWYGRRLLRDPAFKRDFAAQKAFAKLRTAISGVYFERGRRAEAEQALREACHLYPISPESVFRTFQTVLTREPHLHASYAKTAMKDGRMQAPRLTGLVNPDGMDRLLLAISFMHGQDPNNAVAATLCRKVERLAELQEKFAAAGKLATGEYAEMSTLFRDISRFDLALHFAERVADDGKFIEPGPVAECLETAMFSQSAGLRAELASRIRRAAASGKHAAWFKDPDNDAKLRLAAEAALSVALDVSRSSVQSKDAVANTCINDAEALFRLRSANIAARKDFAAFLQIADFCRKIVKLESENPQSAVSTAAKRIAQRAISGAAPFIDAQDSLSTLIQFANHAAAFGNPREHEAALRRAVTVDEATMRKLVGDGMVEALKRRPAPGARAPAGTGLNRY